MSNLIIYQYLFHKTYYRDRYCCLLQLKGRKEGRNFKNGGGKNGKESIYKKVYKTPLQIREKVEYYHSQLCFTFMFTFTGRFTSTISKSR